MTTTIPTNTNAGHAAVRFQPRGFVPHWVADLVYVGTRAARYVALWLVLVAIFVRDETLPQPVAWLTGEPLRPLGLFFLAIGAALVVGALPQRPEVAETAVSGGQTVGSARPESQR